MGGKTKRRWEERLSEDWVKMGRKTEQRWEERLEGDRKIKNRRFVRYIEEMSPACRDSIRRGPSEYMVNAQISKAELRFMISGTCGKYTEVFIGTICGRRMVRALLQPILP